MGVYLDSTSESIVWADDAKWTWTPVTQTRCLSFFVNYAVLPTVDLEASPWALLLNNESGNKSAFGIYESGGTRYVECTIFNSSWTVIGSFYTTYSFSINTNYHIVFNASTSGACTIYVNAASQSVTHSSWDDTTSINPTAISTYLTAFGGGSDADVCISHIAFFSDNLSSGEVASIRANPYAFDADANILFSAHCDEMTGTTANDVQTVATQTDGTLTGSPTWCAGPPLGFGGLILASRTLQSLTQGRVLG